MRLFWDNTLLILIPAMLLAVFAQAKVSSTFAKYKAVSTSRGVNSEYVAGAILSSAGVHNVLLERVGGTLTDHYDPRKKVIRLSDSVSCSKSVASVAVAAHECGHAIQHHENYAPLAIRNAIAPVAGLVSNLAFPLILVGIILGIAQLTYVAAIAFGAVFLFQLVTLPVEFNASSRALAALKEQNILTQDELYGAKKVLSAAALTYVAATITALAQFLRFMLIARGSGNRN